MKRIALLILLCTCSAFADVPDGLTRVTHLLVCDPEDTPDVTPGKDDLYVKGTGEIDGTMRLDGVTTINNAVTITSPSASTVPFNIVGASGQTGDHINVKTSTGTELFVVTSTGNIENINGFDTVTAEDGPGLWIMGYGEDTPEHTNQTGWYDHTGGTFEKTFHKVSGDDFTEADATAENFIVFQGTQHPKAAEIKTYIDGSTVIVKTMGWSGDIASAGSPVSFYIHKHPEFFVGDDGWSEFYTGATGKFEVEGLNFTGDEVFEVEMVVGGDGPIAEKIVADASGFNQVVGLQVNYTTGSIMAGDFGTGIGVAIDESKSASTDATAVYSAFSATTTSSGSLTRNGVSIGPGFTNALKIQGASAENPDYGYETTGGTAIDRVNSGGAGDDAFINTSTNQEIFSSVGDDILVGDGSQFETVEVILSTPSDKDLELTFWYSKAGGNWTSLTIQKDGTDGMKKSGLITFNAPSDWTKDNEDIDGNAITDAYYIAATRGRIGDPPVDAIESFFKIFLSQDTGMKIKGTGIVNLPYIGAIPDGVENGDIWMESDGLHVYYNGSERLVGDGAP